MKSKIYIVVKHICTFEIIEHSLAIIISMMSGYQLTYQCKTIEDANMIRLQIINDCSLELDIENGYATLSKA